MYAFTDPAHLEAALRVPAPGREVDNQRLEFLGDAVLQILSTDQLFRAYSKDQEGALTDKRKHLVSGAALLQLAQRIGLEDLLKQHNPGLTIPSKAVIDAFEALFGAIWLDGGFTAVTDFWKTIVRPEDIERLVYCTGDTDNPKGQLQQLMQRLYTGIQPVYQVISQTGPMHAPQFTVRLELCGRTVEGTGNSRRAAEQQAARAYLMEIKE